MVAIWPLMKGLIGAGLCVLASTTPATPYGILVGVLALITGFLLILRAFRDLGWE